MDGRLSSCRTRPVTCLASRARRQAVAVTCSVVLGCSQASSSASVDATSIDEVVACTAPGVYRVIATGTVMEPVPSFPCGGTSELEVTVPPNPSNALRPFGLTTADGLVSTVRSFGARAWHVHWDEGIPPGFAFVNGVIRAQGGRAHGDWEGLLPDDLGTCHVRMTYSWLFL